MLNLNVNVNNANQQREQMKNDIITKFNERMYNTK